MGQRKSSVTPARGADQAMRDQEVLRANKELAAYFKGRRTEREARAALKIIKAFVRDRERRDAGSRPPLPGAQVVKPVKEVVGSQRRLRRKPREKSPERTIPEQAQLSESGDHTPE
jgi:hypothetical protein